MELLYRSFDLGWRSRHVVGALRLRPPIAEHSPAESAMLMRYAEGARTIVELGVAEGGSAAELRSVMAENGTLFLVDPYESRPSMSRIVARRAVRSVHRGEAVWLRERSGDAGVPWSRTIDFLFIDADHTYEGASADWRLWSPHVRRGGCVAFHDSRKSDWVGALTGPARLVSEIQATDAEWEIAGEADSLTVLRRLSDHQ